MLKRETLRFTFAKTLNYSIKYKGTLEICKIL